MFEAQVEAAISNKILDREYHKSLILDLENCLAIANVPAIVFFKSSTEYCTEAQISFVTSHHLRATSAKLTGLMLSGDPTMGKVQMESMASAYLKNYIDARVVTVHELLEKGNQDKNCSVLLIPDFFIDKEGMKGDIAKWNLPVLLDVLYKRASSNKPTVVYVSDLRKLKGAYGDIFVRHFNEYFTEED